MGDLDISDEDLRLLLAVAVFLNWIRIIGFFRIFKHTRYLIRMIIEIAKGIIPFLAIVFIFTLAMAFCLMALRDVKFLDMWDIAYKLNYGEFEELHESHIERILFLIATLSMTLLMLNLLIAIMSDRYDFIQENLVVADMKEKLSLIEEVGRLLCRSNIPRKKRYIKECSEEFIDDAEIDDSLNQ